MQPTVTKTQSAVEAAHWLAAAAAAGAEDGVTSSEEVAAVARDVPFDKGGGGVGGAGFAARLRAALRT
eukprot:4700484-Prymnesium_polylepis.1